MGKNAAHRRFQEVLRLKTKYGGNNWA